MDTNTLKWLGAGVVIYLLFIKKKEESITEIIELEPPAPLLGCINPLASNFNNLADTDDGSCIITSSEVLGCMDSTANNFNSLANVDDASCDYTTINTDVIGCMNPIANNYDPLATIDSNECQIPTTPIRGCTNPLADNYNASATTDNGSCTYVGCSSPTSFGYNYITSSTVSMNWNAVGAADTYTLRLRVAGTTDWYINPSPIVGIPPSGNSTESIVFGPLTPNTNYEWQVGSVCAGIGAIWMSPSQYFTTL